ncbi:MAG: hypothetical protein OXH50_19920, partial [Gemmatimonadetes bacterium]|nr:hypothetical protein [Gemmatimonadota bacterium]
AETPSLNPPDPAPGQYFTLSVAIHNRGESPAPATTLHYYRSTDSTITGDDTEVAARPLRGLTTPGTSFKLIRLRAPTSRGTYYYGACVEPVDGEVETGNNCSPAAELVVGEGPVTHPAKAPTRRQVPTCISPAWRPQPFSGSTSRQPLVGVMPVLQVVEQHS